MIATWDLPCALFLYCVNRSELAPSTGSASAGHASCMHINQPVAAATKTSTPKKHSNSAFSYNNNNDKSSKIVATDSDLFDALDLFIHDDVSATIGATANNTSAPLAADSKADFSTTFENEHCQPPGMCWCYGFCDPCSSFVVVLICCSSLPPTTTSTTTTLWSAIDKA